jgi:hypothetical protein
VWIYAPACTLLPRPTTPSRVVPVPVRWGRTATSGTTGYMVRSSSFWFMACLEHRRIPQQPTALEAGNDPRIAATEAVLHRRGFLAVQRVPDMDGWLAYHAVFVSGNGAALSIVAPRIPFAWPRTAVRSGSCVGGLPRNLTVFTIVSVDGLRCAIGRGACAQEWANCASLHTRDTPKPRCAPLPAMSSPVLVVVLVRQRRGRCWSKARRCPARLPLVSQS